MAHVSIFDDIGIFGATADDLIAQIGNAQKLSLTINSRGGDSRTAWKVFDALADRQVECDIIGACYSSAIIIAQSAARIRVEQSARLMVHPARTWILADEIELFEAAKTMRATNGRLRELFALKTGQTAATVAGWMDGKDHYFSAPEAVAAGLAHDIFTLPPAQPIEPGAPTPPGPTPDETLFFNFLRAFGPFHVQDLARFERGVASWIAYHTK